MYQEIMLMVTYFAAIAENFAQRVPAQRLLALDIFMSCMIDCFTRDLALCSGGFRDVEYCMPQAK